MLTLLLKNFLSSSHGQNYLNRPIKAENIGELPKMIIKLDYNKWRQYFLDKAKSLKAEIAK